LLAHEFFFSFLEANIHLVIPNLSSRDSPYRATCSAQLHDTFKKVLLGALQNDPTLGQKKLLPQLQGLILDPLLKVDPNRRPVLIILGALYECNGAA
jgi:hypothetical protein